MASGTVLTFFDLLKSGRRAGSVPARRVCNGRVLKPVLIIWRAFGRIRVCECSGLGGCCGYMVLLKEKIQKNLFTSTGKDA